MDMTDHQIQVAYVVIAAFAALGIPGALRAGLGSIATALDDIRSELHEYNETRRLDRIVQNSTKDPR
jgi:hypothetical protein